MNFQSTLLQEERPPSLLPPKEPIVLSIHAPTRGATSPIHIPEMSLDAFNPRSYKRSDINFFNNFFHTFFFQSTLLQEERPFTHF